MFNVNLKAIALAGATALFALMGAALWVQSARLESSDAAFAALSDRHKTLAEAHNRALERAAQDRKVLVARQAKIASQSAKLQHAQQALSEALQHEKAWSDTDVPTAVQNALSGRSGGPDSAPVGVLDGSDRP
jgi:predicted TPR repeat methyltransferase